MCNVVMKKNVLMFFLHIQCYNGFILEYEKSTPGSSFMFYKEADEHDFGSLVKLGA